MVLALVPATWERDFCATQHESRKMSKMPRYDWVPAIVHCQINAADSIHWPQFVTHEPRKKAHALGLTKTRATGRKAWRVWLPTPARFKRLTGHGPRFTVRLGRPTAGGAGLVSLSKKWWLLARFSRQLPAKKRPA